MKKLYICSFLFVLLTLPLSACGNNQEAAISDTTVEVTPVDIINTVDNENEVSDDDEVVNSDNTNVDDENVIDVEEANDNWDYPIKSLSIAQQNGLDYEGWIDICNPPDELVHSLSTKELADLALRYPLFPYMPSGATDSEADIFIGVYLAYSNIFEEIRTRENRNICILEAFAQNIPDIEGWDSSEIENEANWAEHFVEQYLFVYSKELTSQEREFYLKTIKEKTENYYCNIKIGYVIPGLSFDEDGTAYRKGYNGR